MGVGFGWMPTYLVESELRRRRIARGAILWWFRAIDSIQCSFIAPTAPSDAPASILVSLLRRYSLANAKPARRAVASQRIR